MLTIIVKVIAGIALALIVKEIGNAIDSFADGMNPEINYGKN